MTQSVSARRRFSFQIERRGGSCLTSNDLQSTVAGREIICPTALITTLFRHGVEFHDENLPSRGRWEKSLSTCPLRRSRAITRSRHSTGHDPVAPWHAAVCATMSRRSGSCPGPECAAAQGTGSMLLRRHPPEGPKPQDQWFPRILEDRTRRERHLVSAASADQQIALGHPA